MRNKSDEASEFLHKFSKLIRMILDNSRQEFILLDQELQALVLYIELEQKRSTPAFKYEIATDDSLFINHLSIPTMVIQPFVENAILHGLRHLKDKEGELYIVLKNVQDQLLIRISDNGIGRIASAQINRLRHLYKQSVGMEVTQARIEKLNDLYPGKASVKVIDIKHEHDSGTIVEIKLPLIKLSDNL